MPAISLGIKGYETSALITPVSGGEAEKWFLRYKINKMKDIMRGTFVDTSQSMRTLYRILLNGQTLIVLVDLPPVEGQSFYEVPFLGGIAKFPIGVAKLALKTDAILVPYFTLEEKGYLSGEFLPSFSVSGMEVEEVILSLFRPVEEKILQYPEQWWMWPWLQAFWDKKLHA